MECNKEEAFRAMKLAEKKMQEKDFVTAQKLGQKAQRLYPEIENISRLLTVCEVHCSALVKLGGSEMDWYKILQIELTADTSAIKRQYRKLAFLLHPDKNMFEGAEAAFKLIAEANRTLSDDMKRGLYDRKYRDLSRVVVRKPPQSHSNGKPGVQNRHGMANNFQNFSDPQNARSNLNHQVQTFWTRCPSCAVSFQFFMVCLGTTLTCHNCGNHYVANDIGMQSWAPGSSQSFPNQKEVKNQVPRKVPSQDKKGSTSRKRSSSTAMGPQPMSEERENVDVQANKQGAETSKPAAAAKPEKPKSSRKSNNKRARKVVVESSESESESEEDGVEGNVNGSSESKEGHSNRRSSRQKQNVSYKEKLSDDEGDFVSPPKRARASKSASGAEETTEEGFVKSSDGPGPSINGHKKKANTSDHQRMKSTAIDDSETGIDDEARSPEIFSCPDPDFSDFEKDKAENRFAADQIWAIYDPEDGMPRFYACIKKVYKPRFRLRITWLEAKPDTEAGKNWCNEDLPVACGKYGLGSTQLTDHKIFSHQMHCIKGNRNSFVVYPRKGETWAIFRDWDISWCTDPESHKPFKFDFVEILKDFDNNDGVGVAYLGRVKGFVSIFQQIEQNQVLAFHISPTELYRFSHRIPSFRMTGNEREGVPQGSYELDPAALPPSFFESHDHDNTKKEDDASVNAGNRGLFPDPLKSEAERVDTKREGKGVERETPMARRSPRKPNGNEQSSGSQGVVGTGSVKNDEKSHGNLTPSKRGATVSQADEQIATPKKQESHQEAESLRLRRSPRDLAKKHSEANGSRSANEEESEKVEHAGADVKPTTCSSGMPNGKLSQAESFDFTQLTSQDKFKVGQIWALRTGDNTYPKTYGKVKKISSTAGVFLVLLDPYPMPKDKSQRACCGTFKPRHERSRPYQLSSFSHCVTATEDANSYKIYPCKGEIWAMYKNQSAGSTHPDPSKSEYDIVEVLENDGGLGTKVVVLSRFGGSGSTTFKAPRVQKSKKIPVVEVPRAEMLRFSHRIMAFRHTGEGDGRLAGCWELDPRSTPASSGSGVICLD